VHNAGVDIASAECTTAQPSVIAVKSGSCCALYLTLLHCTLLSLTHTHQTIHSIDAAQIHPSVLMTKISERTVGSGAGFNSDHSNSPRPRSLTPRSAALASHSVGGSFYGSSEGSAGQRRLSDVARLKALQQELLLVSLGCILAVFCLLLVRDASL
jgi:hypothetical protein